MKKILLSLLCLFSIFILVGCGKSVKNNTDIVDFTYSYGSYNDGHYEYNINVKDEKIVFTANGFNGVNLNINKEIDKSYLEKLSKIINDNDIYKWDGFDKHNYEVNDGYSFYFEVKYQNGEKITASGAMKYPENYDKSHKILVNFLESID